MDKLITCAGLDKKAPGKGQEHLTQNWIVWLQCFEMVLSADRDLGQAPCDETQLLTIPGPPGNRTAAPEASSYATTSKWAFVAPLLPDLDAIFSLHN